jgi:shikimate kinase
MNLVLIGYRGTGKSEISRLLAETLGMPCVGMDSAIVARAGMPIPEIVARYGWPGFRDLESAQVRELSGWDGIIIDTGGGVIERPENIAALGENARVFWMKASVATIVSRIQGDGERPALTAGKSFTEEVAEVLARRTPLYRSAAHHEIDTDNLAPAEIAARIVAIWRKEAPQ